MKQTLLLGEKGFPRLVAHMTLPQQGACLRCRAKRGLPFPEAQYFDQGESHAANSSLFGHWISNLNTERNGNLKMWHMLQALCWLIQGFLIKCLLNSSVIFGRSQWSAARSKAWTLFTRWNAGIVGSNPIQRTDVSVRSFSVCVVLRVCVGSGFATGWCPCFLNSQWGGTKSLVLRPLLAYCTSPRR
jgi:hypothetical protein